MLHSVLTLEVLLHTYYSPTPHPKRNIEVYAAAHDYLHDQGMIMPQDGIYVATAKGKFMVEYILELPFPEIIYVIPEKSVTGDKVPQSLSDSGVSLSNLVK